MKRSIRSALSFVTLLALGTTASAQTVWYVDDDAPGDVTVGGGGNPFISDPNENGSLATPFDRIQEAIDAASDNDEVVVLPGTYYDFTTIDLSSGMGSSKSLWIHSTDGAAATIVDASALLDSVMQAVSGEDANTILEGFTLQGGFVRGGGGGDRGGGINIGSSSPTILDCVLRDNEATYGGGVYSTSGAPTFRGCRFEDNTAWRGGGLYINTAGVLDSCHFEGNASEDHGGGALLNASIPVGDCVFLQNSAVGAGGGIYQWVSSPFFTVERTVFTDNTAAGGASGFHGSTSSAVRNSVFNANDSASSSGAVWGAGMTMDHCTLAANTGYALRGGLVRNSILWGNSPQEAASSAILYSNVLGGYSGTGNVDVDPRFVDPWGPDNVLGTLDDDLSLGGKSPCIDAANASYAHSWGAQYPVDVVGNPRVVDWDKVDDTGVAVVGQSADMGAYERQPKYPMVTTRKVKP